MPESYRSNGHDYTVPQYTDPADAPKAFKDLVDSIPNLTNLSGMPPVGAAQPNDILAVDPMGTTAGWVAASTIPGLIGPQGPQGLQGPEGLQGPQGPQGTSVTVKSAVATVGDLPAADPSINGEVHFVTGTGDLYICDGTTWTNMGHVAGPQGPAGAKGTDGKSVTFQTLTAAAYAVLATKDPQVIYLISG